MQFGGMLYYDLHGHEILDDIVEHALWLERSQGQGQPVVHFPHLASSKMSLLTRVLGDLVCH